MAWITGKMERRFTIDAPYEKVLRFFSEPSEFRAAFGEMEGFEELEPGVWKWTLEEKSEKGLTYQGIYTVEYTKTDSGLTWKTREGNARSTGESKIKDLGGGKAEVDYREELQTDLPIPRLMAKVFNPIVGREVAKGIGNFLDAAKEILESGD